MSSPTRENPGSDLTVERLGELAGMSPRNFTRVFAREIGMTPGKFVALSRLESARRYLEQSTMPVGDCPRVRVQHHGRNAAGLRPKPGRDAARIPAAILLKAIRPPRTPAAGARSSLLFRPPGDVPTYARIDPPVSGLAAIAAVASHIAPDLNSRSRDHLMSPSNRTMSISVSATAAKTN